MTIPRFFVDTPPATGVEGQLDAEQSRQARSTLRLRPGAQIVVLDGSGAEAVATITGLRKEAVSWRVDSVSHPARQPPIRLRVALALLRGERFDWAVQKLTEVGVERITPLAAERCVVSFPVAADWARRADRLNRVIREAAEQSERVTLPRLDSPVSLPQLLDQGPTVVLVERADAAPIATLPLTADLTLAVGPEGGWSPGELRMIAERAKAAALGRLILRAETAAIVAAGTIIQCAWSAPEDRADSWQV